MNRDATPDKSFTGDADETCASSRIKGEHLESVRGDGFEHVSAADGNDTENEGGLSVDAPRSTDSSVLFENRGLDTSLVIEEDRSNGTDIATLNERHAKLLDGGWRPIRWRHPEYGDLELTSGGFWVSIEKDGLIFTLGPGDKVMDAIKSGHMRFVRDPDGNLLAESADDKAGH